MRVHPALVVGLTALAFGALGAGVDRLSAQEEIQEPCLEVYDLEGVLTGYATPEGAVPSDCVAPPAPTTTEPCENPELGCSTTTTVPETTTTTVAPTTTTTVAPTTTVPPGPTVFDFATAESLDELEIEIHHRTDHDGGQPAGAWLGDHDHDCGAPETKRMLTAEDRAGAVYWCPNGAGHFMTSMGEVDGYSIVSVSPFQVFHTVSRVCWDQNVSASLGTRQWVEVLVVPASVIDTPHPSGHRITFNNPFIFEIDGTVRPHVPGVFQVGVAPISGDSGSIVDGVISPDIAARFGNPNDPTGRASIAIRRQHCLTETPAGVEFRVETDGDDWVGIVPDVVLPDASRVILSTHHYTPTKDQGFEITTTWHWDNLIVEG
jgi:hypothetical protein